MEFTRHKTEGGRPRPGVSLTRMASVSDLKSLLRLIQAAERGQLDIVIGLIDEGIDVNVVDGNNRTALHKAANKGHGEVVAYLLKKEARVHILDEDGCDAFYYAAFNGYTAIMDQLIQSKADINVNRAGKEGRTPLYDAAERGHAKTVRYLLEKGAIFDMVDEQGYTPLHIAASNANIEVLKLLIDKGASVDCGDDNGRTALSLATEKKLADTAKYLFNRGANIHLIDRSGKSPLDYALTKGYTEILDHFGEHQSLDTIDSPVRSPATTPTRRQSPAMSPERTPERGVHPPIPAPTSSPHSSYRSSPVQSSPYRRTVAHTPSPSTTPKTGDSDLRKSAIPRPMPSALVKSQSVKHTYDTGKLPPFLQKMSSTKVIGSREDTQPISVFKPSVLGEMTSISETIKDIDSDITEDMYLPYETLKNTKIPLGVDITRKEMYLSPSEFSALFGMSKEAFSSQAKWKRDTKKKELGLF